MTASAARDRKAATEDPADTEAPWHANARVVDGGKFDDTADVTPLSRPTTDLGNAERLVDQHGEDIRYFTPAKTWFVWDGARWAEDRTLKVHRLAQTVVRAIYDEAAEATDSDSRKALAKWAVASEASGRLASVVDLARPKVPVVEEDLDSDPWLLNCPNGTIDLSTGDLLEHRREDLITKMTGVPYDPDALCPRWEQFLHEIMGGDLDLIAYMRRAVGYTLTGVDTEQAFLVLYGGGANGKSTFVNALDDVLGDYAGTCGKDTLAAGLRKSQGGANEELVEMRGKRLVSATETEQGEPLAEAMVKRLTGGEKITARKLFGHNITFRPTFTIWLSTNHLPQVKGTDTGIWRRLKLVPFSVTFSDDQKDPDLAEKLRSESAGILAWAVRGCLEWQEHRLETPGAVLKATANYRAESDHLQAFIDDECFIDPHEKVDQRTLYARYVKWFEEGGEHGSMSSLDFKRSMERRGFEVKRTTVSGKFTNAFLGLRIEDAMNQAVRNGRGDWQ